jgi:cysteine desulfuration protein SufE|tara:strand:+ start:333 stop:749 length:417 start_codon:yes stop_codon:yes gene_type:complete
VIQEKLKRYVDALNAIPEMQDKYLWLMEFGKKSEGLVDDLKLPEFEVPGCQSQTWLVPGYHTDNKLYFSADSAALISKGMVCLLADIFSGFTGSDITSFDTKSLDDLKLDILLTPGRRNGVYSMLKKIQGYGRRAALS